MKTAAIICEYNPFHKGHQSHIQMTKERTGADYIIALMSGSFVQRGEPAIMDKQLRTKMALSSGAHVVLELPVWYSCASAPLFAAGSISLLTALHTVDYLSFGCESETASPLTDTAEFLADHEKQLHEQSQKHQKNGCSYPAARQLAMEDLGAPSDMIQALQTPNNLLAIQYLKELKLQGSPIKPLAVQRRTSNCHDTNLGKTGSSATAIRSSICGSDDISKVLPYVPEDTKDLYRAAFHQRFPVTPDDFSLLLKDRILSLSSRDPVWDLSPDLKNRLEHLYDPADSFTSLVEKCKNKSLTWSYISRSFLHLLLGMDASRGKELTQTGAPLYWQILGFQTSAGPLIKQLKANATWPMVRHFRPHKDPLSRFQTSMLQTDAGAWELYRLIAGHKYGAALNDHQIIESSRT